MRLFVKVTTKAVKWRAITKMLTSVFDLLITLLPEDKEERDLFFPLQKDKTEKLSYCIKKTKIGNLISKSNFFIKWPGLQNKSRKINIK